MEIHHFQSENPLFLWPFSIATLNYQRVDLVMERAQSILLKPTTDAKYAPIGSSSLGMSSQGFFSVLGNRPRYQGIRNRFPHIMCVQYVYIYIIYIYYIYIIYILYIYYIYIYTPGRVNRTIYRYWWTDMNWSHVQIYRYILLHFCVAENGGIPQKITVLTGKWWESLMDGVCGFPTIFRQTKAKKVRKSCSTTSEVNYHLTL